MVIPASAGERDLGQVPRAPPGRAPSPSSGGRRRAGRARSRRSAGATRGRPAGARSTRGRRPGSRPRPTGRRHPRRRSRGAARGARRGRPTRGPPGATARTGTPGSTRATGPCWKSAAEYGSAKTWASSLSLSAHSRAVAYSKPRPRTTQRSTGARSPATASTSASTAERLRRSRPAIAAELRVRRAARRARRGRQPGDREQRRRVGLRRGDGPLRSGAPGRSRARPPRRAAEAGSLVMASVGAPWSRAAATTPTMSGDAPDWLIPMTSARSNRGSTP